MHHATVFDLDVVLLLIGSVHQIIRGLWVKFDHFIKVAYENFLTRIYRISISWINDVSLPQMSNDNIAVLLPKTIDVESFQDLISLWRVAMLAPTAKLPLPNTHKIIPYHFTLWNKFEGGSDTLTKLFWSSKHHVPKITPGTTAVAQIIRCLAATIYRCDGIFTAKENLDSYQDLLHYRSATNKRQTSFKSFLLDMVKK